MMKFATAVAVLALTSIATAKPASVVVGPTLPDFGCLGWSDKLGVAACLVGSRGTNIGESRISVVFVPVRDEATEIEPLVVRQTDQRGPDELSATEHATLVKRLAGFVTIDRSGPVLRAKMGGTPAPITVGGATLSAKATALAKTDAAPRYRVVMTYTRDKAKRALDDRSDSISGYEARVLVIAGTQIVERAYSTGDEGIYGDYGTVWRCTKTACDEPLE